MDFECFMEEQIIIREEIKIDQEYDKTSKYAQSGRAVEQALKTTIGRSTINLGEIFNDYSTNKALSRFSSARGSNNIAGILGFNITAYNPYKKSYVLSGTNGLEVGDKISIKWNNSYINVASIVSIDKTTNTIVVDNFISDSGDNPFLFIIDKPLIGTNSFDFGQYTEGVNNRAYLYGAHSEGYGNISIGRYSHSGGKYSEAQQDCSFVHGLYLIATNTAQAVFGQYNAKDNSSLFLVGGGTSEDNRKNLFAVKTDGTARLPSLKNEKGEADATAIGTSLYSIATKGYVDNKIANLDIDIDLSKYATKDELGSLSEQIDDIEKRHTKDIEDIYGDIYNLSEDLGAAESDIGDLIRWSSQVDEELDVFSTDLAAVSTDVTELKTDIEEVLDYILASQASYLGGV